MITCKYAPPKDYTGTHEAQIVGVEVIDNQFYDPEKPWSTEHQLNIEFAFELDGVTEKFIQNFVAPTTGNDGLFQQILDVMGEIPDNGDWNFEPMSMIKTEGVISIIKDKKGYNRVVEFKAKK